MNYVLLSDERFVSEDELYHHGVKGMKWGVRNISVSNAGRKQRSHTPKSTNVRKKAVKAHKRGKRFVDHLNNKKVKTIIGTTTSVAAGALRVASAFIPGNIGGVSNSAAAVANIVSVASSGTSLIE